jgi:hypothetical protein
MDLEKEPAPPPPPAPREDAAWEQEIDRLRRIGRGFRQGVRDSLKRIPTAVPMPDLKPAAEGEGGANG